MGANMNIRDRYNLAQRLRSIVNKCRRLVELAGTIIGKHLMAIKNKGFNIVAQLDRYKQIAVDKIHGLPDYVGDVDKQIQHLSNSLDVDSDIIAEREAMAVNKSFKGCCTYFDKRVKHKCHKNGGNGSGV